MMSQLFGAFRSARMFDAKSASLTSAVAKKSCASGATSCTICSIARPSSLAPPKSSRTVTGVRWPFGLPGPGRFPAATSAAAAAQRVEAVGQDADPDAGAGVSVGVAGVVGPVRAVALRGDRSRRAAAGGPRRGASSRAPPARRTSRRPRRVPAGPTAAWRDCTAGWRNVTSARAATASACARSMRARIVRYCHDGARISPPSASICDGHRVERRHRADGDVHGDPAARDPCRRWPAPGSLRPPSAAPATRGRPAGAASPSSAGPACARPSPRGAPGSAAPSDSLGSSAAYAAGKSRSAATVAERSPARKTRASARNRDSNRMVPPAEYPQRVRRGRTRLNRKRERPQRK